MVGNVFHRSGSLCDALHILDCLQPWDSLQKENLPSTDIIWKPQSYPCWQGDTQLYHEDTNSQFEFLCCWYTVYSCTWIASKHSVWSSWENWQHVGACVQRKSYYMGTRMCLRALDVRHKNIELRYHKRQFHLCTLPVGFSPDFIVN